MGPDNPNIDQPENYTFSIVRKIQDVIVGASLPYGSAMPAPTARKFLTLILTLQRGRKRSKEVFFGHLAGGGGRGIANARKRKTPCPARGKGVWNVEQRTTLGEPFCSASGPRVRIPSGFSHNRSNINWLWFLKSRKSAFVIDGTFVLHGPSFTRLL